MHTYAVEITNARGITQRTYAVEALCLSDAAEQGERMAQLGGRFLGNVEEIL